MCQREVKMLVSMRCPGHSIKTCFGDAYHHNLTIYKKAKLSRLSTLKAFQTGIYVSRKQKWLKWFIMNLKYLKYLKSISDQAWACRLSHLTQCSLMLPVRRQTIDQTDAESLPNRPSRTNRSMSSVKLRPICSGLNALKTYGKMTHDMTLKLTIFFYDILLGSV